MSYLNITSDHFVNETNNNNNNNNITDAAANVILASTALQVIYIIIGVFGFLSNVYVLLVIALYKPMHKQLTNIYIFNQSVVDAAVATFLFFTTIFSDKGKIRVPGNINDEAICRLWYTKMPLWGMLVTSSYGIVALTFERFLAVVYPIWHKTTFTRNKILVALPLTFAYIIGAGFNIGYMTPSAKITEEGHCTVYNVWPSKGTQTAVGIFTVFLQYLAPLLLLSFGYSRMVLVLHKRVETTEGSGMGKGEAGGKEAKRNESMARARTNVIKTLGIVAFFFILCWTWNQVYYLLFYLGYSKVDFTSNFYNFTVIMVFINCCVNPVVYTLNYAQFKAGVRQVFLRNKVRPDVGQTSGVTVSK